MSITDTAERSPIPNGSRVKLPDGTLATAYQHRRIGCGWSGEYVTVQVFEGRERRDYGWRRESLTVVGSPS